MACLPQQGVSCVGWQCHPAAFISDLGFSIQQSFHGGECELLKQFEERFLRLL